MKVLLFRPHCGTGGIMTWMLLHARELRRLGVECGFWFCQGTTRLPEFEQMGDCFLGLGQGGDRDSPKRPGLHVTGSKNQAFRRNPMRPVER